MIIKLFRAMLLSLVLAPFIATPAPAGQGVRIDPDIKAKGTAPVAVHLKCTWNGPKEFVKVTVTNSIGSTIPQGKTIYWSVNPQTKGSINLQSALPPGGVVSREVPLSGTSPYTPKAWYLK